MRYDKKYFQKIPVNRKLIDRYWSNAKRDLAIAKKDKYPEVRFQYAYQALLKAGITILAKQGGVKVRSAPGHHIQVLKKFSELVNNPDVFTIGNIMRQKRNIDIYGGGEIISAKEATDYVRFVGEILSDMEPIFRG